MCSSGNTGGEQAWVNRTLGNSRYLYEIRTLEQLHDNIKRQANYFVYPSSLCSHCAWPSSSGRPSFLERRGGRVERAPTGTVRKVLTMARPALQ